MVSDWTGTLLEWGAELERLKNANSLQPAKLADLQTAAAVANVAVTWILYGDNWVIVNLTYQSFLGALLILL